MFFSAASFEKKRAGPRRVGPRRVVGPKFRAFFPSPAPIFTLFVSLWVSSRGILVVFEAPKPSNVSVWALGLSCETPVRRKGDPEGPTTTHNNTQQQRHIAQQHITKGLAKNGLAKWAGQTWIGQNWIGQSRPLPFSRGEGSSHRRFKCSRKGLGLRFFGVQVFRVQFFFRIQVFRVRGGGGRGGRREGRERGVKGLGLGLG